MELNIETLTKVAAEFRRMDAHDFAGILERSINASEDYAMAMWLEFCRNPLDYITSRHPQIQGKALLEWAFDRIKQKTSAS